MGIRFYKSEVSGSKSRYTLVPLVREALSNAGIPLSPWTLREWRKIGRHPEIFVKLGRRVFLVLEKWEKLVEKELKNGSKRQR